jgi:hypothetical protein
MELTMAEEQTKKLLKEVVLELMQERPDIFLDIMVEVLEEAGFAAAVREGRLRNYVDEGEIRAIVSGRF